jgi:hypothetical protein
MTHLWCVAVGWRSRVQFACMCMVDAHSSAVALESLWWLVLNARAAPSAIVLHRSSLNGPRADP